MHEFILNIDNKEILNDILHHSVDYMIGSCRDHSMWVKSSHKYGFASPEDFESSVKTIADIYKMYFLESLTDAELLSHFTHLSQDLQQSVIDAVKARKQEIALFLLREHNSKTAKLLESFDWDIRYIMGDSNSLTRREHIVNMIFNCTENGKKTTMHFELNKGKLNELIAVLEEAFQKLLSKSEQEINARSDTSDSKTIEVKDTTSNDIKTSSTDESNN